MQLFLGVSLEGDLWQSYEALPASIKNESEYLSCLSHNAQVYLGKYMGAIFSLSQLEASTLHIQSLVKKLIPDHSETELSFYLIPINDDA